MPSSASHRPSGVLVEVLVQRGELRGRRAGPVGAEQRRRAATCRCWCSPRTSAQTRCVVPPSASSWAGRDLETRHRVLLSDRPTPRLLPMDGPRTLRATADDAARPRPVDNSSSPQAGYPQAGPALSAADGAHCRGAHRTHGPGAGTAAAIVAIEAAAARRLGALAAVAAESRGRRRPPDAPLWHGAAGPRRDAARRGGLRTGATARRRPARARAAASGRAVPARGRRAGRGPDRPARARPLTIGRVRRLRPRARRRRRVAPARGARGRRSRRSRVHDLGSTNGTSSTALPVDRGRQCRSGRVSSSGSATRCCASPGPATRRPRSPPPTTGCCVNRAPRRDGAARRPRDRAARARRRRPGRAACSGSPRCCRRWPAARSPGSATRRSSCSSRCSRR